MTFYERKLLIILSALSIVLLIANTYLHSQREVHLKIVPTANVTVQ